MTQFTYVPKNFIEVDGRHLKAHIISNHIKCKFCENYFKDAGVLMRHISDNHYDVGVCQLCNNIFTDFTSLKEHMKKKFTNNALKLKIR